jgi:hypothetical protein
MEDNQLKLLEQRVSNAVTFIEKLKSREKSLQDEKERIEQKVVSMQRVIEEKDLKIEALRENQLFLKNKIETILDKLEGLASLKEVTEEGSEQAENQGGTSFGRDASEEGTAGDDGSEISGDQEKYTGEEAESESIIVEENLVDLKDEQTENQEQDNTDTSTREDDGTDDGKNEVESKEDAEKKNRYEGQRDNNLFDNPFIEM